MQKEQYLDHLEAESRRLIDVAFTAEDAAIPWCGDWNVRGLIDHMGMVWSIATANVDAATGEKTAPGDNALAPDTGRIEWLEGIRTRLLEVLRAADPSSPSWTFTPSREAAFWQRRMVQETLVHRWDAEKAAGDLTPMPVELARDGIEEFLAVGLRHSSSRPERDYPTESLHLHCTDTEGEWMLVGHGISGFTVTHEHGKGDAAVRGTAENILLWIWGRPGADVQIFGDEVVASAWQALAP